MQDPVRMRERRRFAHTLEHAKPFAEIGFLAEVVGQRAPVDALHHVEGPAIEQPPGVVHRYDAWMFEPGQHA
jgi:hypothetical protein